MVLSALPTVLGPGEKPEAPWAQRNIMYLGQGLGWWWVLSDATGRVWTPGLGARHTLISSPGPVTIFPGASSTNTGCPVVSLFICATRAARVGEGFLGLLSARALPVVLT